MASNYQRCPLVKGGSSAAVINNVMSNCPVFNFNADYTPEPSYAAAVGNVFLEGHHDSWVDSSIYVQNGVPGTEIYIADNQTYTGTFKTSTSFDPLVSDPPIWPPGYSPLSSGDTQEYVLSNAGARPADRDAVDNRVINDVINGTGQIIDSQDDVGGWPTLAENYRAFDAPSNPNGDDDGDGYTNLEELLHAYAAEVEGCSSNTADNESAGQQ